LRRQSREDGLTGLANRRCFDEFLQRSWQQALARRQSLALILSDVDYFKKYNDGYGHPAGDACLAAVAAAMAAVPLPAQALLARYGGEEFVLLAALNLPAAAALAEALRVAVAALAIDHQYSPVSPQVTLSLGVAVCEVTNHGSAALLLQQADTALYQAKQQGRNCVCVYPG
jgi:diguanylate cyclase (GGDEF)-like protein